MNPEHLIEQAELLVKAPDHGPSRQVDKRRAVSAAYYAVFHAVLRRTADELVGVVHRASPRYALAYRSVTHTRVAAICKEALKTRPSAAYSSYVPPNGFDENLRAFSFLFIELMRQRHEADHSPTLRQNTADVRRTIEQAKRAVAALEAAARSQVQLFVTLLVCDPRG